MSRRSEVIENLLVKIIVNHELSEQSDIQEKLREQGVDLPQSTLSRWLKKLNIVKINHRYQIINQDSLSRIPVFSIKYSLPNLIVLHTLPGHANPLAYQIDQKVAKTQGEEDPYAGVIGTIAGDDTLLIILQNEKSLSDLKQRLELNTENFYILFD